MTRVEKMRICRDVIDHWTCNLLLAYAGEMENEDRDEAECAFCKVFGVAWCTGCPLSLYGGEECSVWTIWGETGDLQPASCAAMLRELERVCDLWMADKEAV